MSALLDAACRLATLVNAGVDLGHAHLRLDVMDPAVMCDAGLGWAGEAEDRAGQSASGDDRITEFPHFGAFNFRSLLASGISMTLLLSRFLDVSNGVGLRRTI
jgi:hypothetical protein